MVKSFKLFFLLVLVFFLADRGVFFTLKSFNARVDTGQGVGKVNTFFKVKDSVDLLIFGSSRAAHHVHIADDISSFNMGRDATKVAFAGALISTLKKKDQIILVHVDHDWLFEKSYKGTDVLPLRFNALLNDDIHDYLKKYFPEELMLSKVSNAYACNGKMLPIVKNFFSEGFDYSENRGYEPIFPSKEQQIIFTRSWEINQTKMNEGIHKPLVEDTKFENIIDAIVKSTTKNGSKLIFFTSPSLNKVDSEVKGKMQDFFDSKNLTYWNDIDFFDTMVLSDWKDRTHLSGTGAEKYSDYLNKKLQGRY